jgi:hypothetical protein
MNRTLYETFELLGVKGGRLPDEGIEPQPYKTPRFGWVAIWVEPRVGKQHFIRTRCHCPKCDRELAYSRLPQHVCKLPTLLQQQAG